MDRKMDRRQFLKTAVATTVVVGVSGGIYLSSAGDTRDHGILLDETVAELDLLGKKTLTSTGRWDPAQVFNHCAQSVEFSISGYAEHKSVFFKSTVGQLAFWAFSANGSMTHGLDEPIPGAPLLLPRQPVHSALVRLKKALTDFKTHTGVLAPHFAYGALSKSQYTLAHIMHLNNHLEQIHQG
jgi:hypothetical protein